MAHRGRLVSAGSSGSAVYAAAFLRERKIILESGLLSDPHTFPLILVHELFHFVWLRLGNSVRREFSCLLLDERSKGARGELGESSGVQKALVNGVWRDYVCESFCDTAAWFYIGEPYAGSLYAGREGNALFTLRKRWRERRKNWFRATAAHRPWKC